MKFRNGSDILMLQTGKQNHNPLRIAGLKTFVIIFSVKDFVLHELFYVRTFSVTSIDVVEGIRRTCVTFPLEGFSADNVSLKRSTSEID